MTTVSPVREAEAPAVPARQKRRLPPKVLIGRIGIHVMLLALAVIYIFPFVVSVASSLKTNAEATQQPLRLIPETLTFAAYERLFTDVPLMKWTFNSALVTIWDPSPGTPCRACSGAVGRSSSPGSSR